MGHYIGQQGSYYEGDKTHWRDQHVVPRPSAKHTYQNGAWVPRQDTVEEAAEKTRGAEREAVRADALTAYLLRHAPAECSAHVANQVTSLKDAKDMLGKFAEILCVLVKASR